MDIIFIEQLSVITTIGVYDWEQKTQQKLLLDVEIGCEKGKAAKTDEVKDCLNYADISKAIIEHIKKNPCALIERVAENVAALLLKKFATPWVRVKVSKPGAIAEALNVSVIIERSNCNGALQRPPQ